MMRGKMKKQFLSILVVGVLALGGVGAANASYIFFDQTTDTIEVTGNINIGTSLTYEARIHLTDVYNGGGAIFTDWSSGWEDKQLYLKAAGFGGYNFIQSQPYKLPINYDTALTLGVTHHIAYVYDGSQERLYLDGQLKVSQAATGDISDHNNGNPYIGALFRGSMRNSFIGYMDTLRISNIARYTGDSFSPMTEDPDSDGNTLLLYNFDESPGSLFVTDMSNYGHTGTLGSGNFSGATSPDFSSPVPIPGAVWLLGSGLVGFVALRRKRKI